MKIAQTEADLRAQLHITEQQKNTRGRLLTKAEERIAAVRKLHRPLDPSMKHTYCDECSPQWGIGVRDDPLPVPHHPTARLMTRPSASVTLTIPKAAWFTSNDRLHWADRAKRTKAIRTMAGIHARSTGPFNTVTIDATVSYPSSRRADPHNVMGTVIKAAIDGLVDAGTLPDDNAKHLTKTSIELGPPTRTPGTYTVTLNIQENP